MRDVKTRKMKARTPPFVRKKPVKSCTHAHAWGHIIRTSARMYMRGEHKCRMSARMRVHACNHPAYMPPHVCTRVGTYKQDECTQAHGGI